MSRITQWIPMTIAVIVALLMAVLFTARPEPFEPVTTKEIRIIGQGPFRAGDLVTVQNGLCNNSSGDLAMNVKVGVQEVVTDALRSARTIELFAREDVPLPVGCSGDMPSTNPLPTVIGPGDWRIYLTLEVMGPQAGQIQRETVLSQSFRVVE